MTRNLKALGLALLAVFALGAIGAQASSAADAHEFHSDGLNTIYTGESTTPHEFTVGAVGTVKCEKATVEGTGVGIRVEEKETYKRDEITVKPKYEECSFGGQPAEVFFHDCAYVFDSDTTLGNPTGESKKHANVTIECAANNKITVHTVNCTITVPPQLVEHAVSYTKDTASSTNVIATAHGIEVEKSRTTASQPVNGCLLFPTGAVGKYVGTTTTECRKDPGPPQVDPTTPGSTEDPTTTECSVTDI